jgi:prepilin-type N-terminal cleavage/methylation domain-containing protein
MDRNTGKGFTLIEILIAIGILAFAILGVMALLPAGYTQITSAGRVSSLNHFGQDTIDSLRALPYSDAVNLSAGIHPTTAPLIPSYTKPDGTTGTDYSITWYVQTATPAAGMKKITVEVGHQLYKSGWTKYSTDEVPDQRTARFVTYVTQ